ncbi:MAG: hypothetical protein J6U54_20385 [Clostridiales bacterium]|nr:hypothetical protein [Clostridiales bacterium]
MRVLYFDYNENLRLSEVDDIAFQYDEDDEFMGLALIKNYETIAICTNHDLLDDVVINYLLKEGLNTGAVDLTNNYDYLFDDSFEIDNGEDE